MAIDRAGARLRVATITAWAAAGAAALTAGFAFGATGDGHGTTHAAAATASPPSDLGDSDGAGGDSSDQGFALPSASQSPPAATSGGS